MHEKINSMAIINFGAHMDVCICGYFYSFSYLLLPINIEFTKWKKNKSLNDKLTYIFCYNIYITKYIGYH